MSCGLVCFCCQDYIDSNRPYCEQIQCRQMAKELGLLIDIPKIIINIPASDLASYFEQDTSFHYAKVTISKSGKTITKIEYVNDDNTDPNISQALLIKNGHEHGNYSEDSNGTASAKLAQQMDAMTKTILVSWGKGFALFQTNYESQVDSIVSAFSAIDESLSGALASYQHVKQELLRAQRDSQRASTKQEHLQIKLMLREMSRNCSYFSDQEGNLKRMMADIDKLISQVTGLSNLPRPIGD